MRVTMVFLGQELQTDSGRQVTARKLAGRGLLYRQWAAAPGEPERLFSLARSKEQASMLFIAAALRLVYWEL
jgi:hypothetical protein